MNFNIKIDQIVQLDRRPELWGNYNQALLGHKLPNNYEKTALFMVWMFYLSPWRAYYSINIL